MSEGALRMPAPDSVKSELAEWVAICQAELGFPSDMVLASFETAIRLESFERPGEGKPGRIRGGDVPPHHQTVGNTDRGGRAGDRHVRTAVFTGRVTPIGNPIWATSGARR